MMCDNDTWGPLPADFWEISWGSWFAIYCIIGVLVARYAARHGDPENDWQAVKVGALWLPWLFWLLGRRLRHGKQRN